ncbi:hypothetical protein JI641_15020 [Listeria ivanovii subsp. londoniensis]|uniref:hypothetical protein n=1 Tax=Listeria ivanovii TaxID=1638 RepID=UPI001903B9D0|nr:hypothetical protein [Listeria ivanovii]MBK2004288.1 hypothetical protein [Listeria ivanovii subsp. londoniensis]
MKIVQLIVNRVFVSSVVLICTLFIIPPVYGIADGNKVTYYEYLYGAPFRWLTVKSSIENNASFKNIFFSGNDGVSIDWSVLAGDFLLIFILVCIIFLISNKLKNRKQG